MIFPRATGKVKHMQDFEQENSLHSREGYPSGIGYVTYPGGMPRAKLLPHFCFLTPLSRLSLFSPFSHFPYPTCLSAKQGGIRKERLPDSAPCTWEGLDLQCVLHGKMTSSKRAPWLTHQKAWSFLPMLHMVLTLMLLDHFLKLFLWCFVIAPISHQSWSRVLLPLIMSVFSELDPKVPRYVSSAIRDRKKQDLNPISSSFRNELLSSHIEDPIRYSSLHSHQPLYH